MEPKTELKKVMQFDKFAGLRADLAEAARKRREAEIQRDEALYLIRLKNLSVENVYAARDAVHAAANKAGDIPQEELVSAFEALNLAEDLANQTVSSHPTTTQPPLETFSVITNHPGVGIMHPYVYRALRATL